MLDAQDLQAIAELIDRKNQELEARLEARFEARMDEKIRESESRMQAYFELAIIPKFDLLAEALQASNEKAEREYAKKQDVERIRDRLDVVEAVVKQHSLDLLELKERKLA